MNAPTFRKGTRAWTIQVGVSFGIAVTSCATGLACLRVQDLGRAFRVMGDVCCLSTAFALPNARQSGLRAHTALYAA